MFADVSEHYYIFVGRVNKETYEDGTDKVFRNVGT